MPEVTSLSNEASGFGIPAIQTVPAEVERAAVDRARTGDQQALADIYDWYMPRVYRYAVARMGNSHEAEDVTEEVFLKLLGAIGDFRWRAVPFSSWVFRIAHNCIATHYRRGPAAGRADGRDTRGLYRPAARRGLRDRGADHDRGSTRGRGRLPEAQREVIALRFAVGLSIAETAKALGKREGNVKALQHKAVAKLQKVLIPGRDGASGLG